jgi:hypothetical protein
MRSLGLNGVDDEESAALAKLSKDNQTVSVMGIIPTLVQQHMRSCLNMLLRLDELTQPGGWDLANNFCH